MDSKLWLTLLFRSLGECEEHLLTLFSIAKKTLNALLR